MASNLEGDNGSVDIALKAGALMSKKDAENQALKEFINQRKTTGIFEMFGKVEYDKDYNFKELR